MSATKKSRSLPPFELLYHPGIPGRGEFIRLVLEASGTPYTDVANENKNGYDSVTAACDGKRLSDDNGNPPLFAPPALRVPGAGKDGKPLIFGQTPNVLMYLAPKVGMSPEGEAEELWARQVALTALDLNNETHDTHHPLAVMKYYEDQKDAALEKATDFRDNRIPKYLGYFERTLKANEEQGKGRYMFTDKLTYADTTVWQVIDGLKFAFPKEMEARSKEYPLLFDTFYPGVKEEVGLKDYLNSDRRLSYSMGIFRHYPELDRQ